MAYISLGKGKGCSSEFYALDFKSRL